jgi:hypothetical protein
MVEQASGVQMAQVFIALREWFAYGFLPGESVAMVVPEAPEASAVPEVRAALEGMGMVPGSITLARSIWQTLL